MCTCASCKYTDSFAAKSFADWPRGEPAGQGFSERAYAAHTRHVRAGAYKTIAFTRGQAPRYPAWTTSKAQSDPGGDRRYPTLRDNHGEERSTARYVADFLAMNQYAKERAPEGARRPAQPGKAKPHFPAPDRERETAKIYDMAKEKAKKPRGRPSIGKPFLVRLEPAQIELATKLGCGNISAGIRKALERKRQSG